MKHFPPPFPVLQCIGPVRVSTSLDVKGTGPSNNAGKVYTALFKCKNGSGLYGNLMQISIIDYIAP